MRLVEEGFPQFIKSLRDVGVVVHAVTSRKKDDWHFKQVVVPALKSWGIVFEKLPDDIQGGVNTLVGGVLFAGGEHKDKGEIISRVVKDRGKLVMLIDNTREKLDTAVENPNVQLTGVHYMKSYQIESNFDKMDKTLCEMLISLNHPCNCQ